MTAQNSKGSRAWTSAGAGVGLGLAALAWPAGAAERVVVVMDPPVVESNLLWQSGIGEPLPWMQSLVGNDPVTGLYDDSGLARAWEASDDFTEWTFHLHEHAEFHFDWGPVTAADVVHSYELHTGPDATYAGIELLRAAEVEAIDDDTVVFRFDEPRTDYAFHHAGRVEMLVYSKAQYEAEGVQGYHDRPAGTAPYRYVERGLGEGTLAERVEDHWQGIEPHFRAGHQARASAVRRGPDRLSAARASAGGRGPGQAGRRFAEPGHAHCHELRWPVPALG